MDVISNLSVNQEVKSKLRGHLLSRWQDLQKDPKYQNGTDDALKMFGLTYGIISENTKEPDLQKAFEAANDYVKAGLARSREQAAALHFQMNSIGSYIKEHYSSEK